MAKKQDMHLVRDILDYRGAQRAVDLMKMGDKKFAFEQLKKNGWLMSLLSRMSRAQRGLPLYASKQQAEAEALSLTRATPTDDEGEDSDG